MEWLVALMSIITVNMLLSGDNALVIALASRNLPPVQQKKAMIWGGAGAIGLRIVLTFVAIVLLQIPYLQLIGGLALLWIAVKLLAGEDENHELQANSNLWGAIKTIIVADVVMSVDNVLAIAGVAKGNVTLLIIGLVISIPIIIWGSKLINMLMERWPIIITIGAAFLGWTGGEMATGDKKIIPLLDPYPWTHWAIPIAFAVIVVFIGSLLAGRKQSGNKEPQNNL
ncbi:TerC family protein [Sporomusa ovata]|uniref:Membrane protein TerC, possibly involved in tellurium resistance n=1 Tax=Sporomusa ovata TaxID=2378 RepID=A0A0U1KYR3_9FIRM|nr:TerC family protein [Sporomusa ovata]CQR72557.1 Membrane protein TerC, possibly involved in tellurium resistance [Sporomusa ovata]